TRRGRVLDPDGSAPRPRSDGSDRPGRPVPAHRPRPRVVMSDAKIPDDFAGTARLFPLPNLVLFPQIVQGLHIFEARYRQLMADALSTDQLITLALLKPGWEADYDGTPAVEPVACLGRVTWHEKLPDGRYNLRLRGLARVQLLGEIPTNRPYRVA